MCGCLLHASLLGTWPATQACALVGNQTGDPLFHSPVLNPLSHTSQGIEVAIFQNKVWALLASAAHTLKLERCRED